MRILWLTPYAPWPPYGGGKMRTANLVRRLAAAGDDIELWAVTDETPGQPEPPVERLRVQHFPDRPRKDLASKIASLVSPLPSDAWRLRSHDAVTAFSQLKGFDVAVLDTALVGAFAPELESARLPWLFDAFDVEHSVMRQISRQLRDPVTRFRFRVDAIKFRWLEGRLVSRSAACAAVSVEDARSLESLNPAAHVTVHPNGVDMSGIRFVDHSRPRGARLLMTGTLGYYPNVDASLFFIHEIMPLVLKRVPTATLTLVGGPVPAELKNTDAPVHVVGPVPDVRPYLSEADLFVIPLRIGGGTRLKALEAMASGMPIVSTRLGVTGLGIVEHDLAVLAETADDFAAAVERGLSDLELRERLVFQGQRYVLENFDFDRIATDFRSTLKTVARS